MSRLTIAIALTLVVSCAPPDTVEGPAADVAIEPVPRLEGAALDSLNAAYLDGVNALMALDAATAALAFERALAVNPGDELAHLFAASAHARNGDAKAASPHLERLAELGSDLVPSPRRFAPIAATDEFQSLRDRIRQAARQSEHSTVAFRIPERDLYPEGIAYDPLEGAFYVSSLFKAKILRVRPLADGTWTIDDFAAERQHGLHSTLGMKVDAPRRRLWVVSTADPGQRGFKPEENGLTAVHRFDLESGALTGLYTPEKAQHGFNDLDLSPGGDAYITDMATGAIWRADGEGGALEVFLPAATFHLPNGIAVADDGDKLYVADWRYGLAAVEIASRQIAPLAHPRGASLRVADGLYHQAGGLIAVMNLAGPGRVTRFVLDAEGSAVTAVEHLEVAHPLFAVPTTGTLVDGDLYYLANSQLDRRAPDGGALPIEELDETVVLRLDL